MYTNRNDQQAKAWVSEISRNNYCILAFGFTLSSVFCSNQPQE